MTNHRNRTRWLGSLALAGLAAQAVAGTAMADDSASDLSALLKRQTEEFSQAGQKGDAATLDKYLDDNVSFTISNGAILTKKQIVDGAAPMAGKRDIKVTHWHLTPMGDVAVATFIDHLTMTFHGHPLVYDYQSTETWAKRPGGWKMIESHTMLVPKDPPAMALPASDLDAYVGTYQLDDSYQVKIWRKGDQLLTSTNGGAATPLKAELRDFMFTPGRGGRRIFERDDKGIVTGFISRRSGNDTLFRKVT